MTGGLMELDSSESAKDKQCAVLMQRTPGTLESKERDTICNIDASLHKYILQGGYAWIMWEQDPFLDPTPPKMRFNHNLRMVALEYGH